METQTERQNAGGARPAHETILLVEDDPVVLNTTARVLNRLGYAVLPYESAREALATARLCGDKIHLLITDIFMPEMNGDRLAKKIWQHLPDLRVLFMSGYDGGVLAGVCESAPHFVSKPFTPQELADKVRTILNG